MGSDGDPFKQLDDSIDAIQQKIQDSIERLKALADPDPSPSVSDDTEYEIIQTFAHGVSKPISCSPCDKFDVFDQKSPIKYEPAPKVSGAEDYPIALGVHRPIYWVREFDSDSQVQAVLIEDSLVELSYQGEKRIVSAIAEHVQTMAAFLYETYKPITGHQKEMQARDAKLAEIEAKYERKSIITSSQSILVFAYHYFYVLCGVCVTLILINVFWVPGDDLLINVLLGVMGGASFAAARSSWHVHMERKAVIEADRTMKAVKQIKGNSSFSCPSCGTTKRNGMYKKGLCSACHQMQQLED